MIIVHCSASDRMTDDCPKAIRELHTSPPFEDFVWGEYVTHGRGWSDIGYHYIITSDGNLHLGRPIERGGAHAVGYNAYSIGICLTGNKIFTEKQFITLAKLARNLMAEFDLNLNNIIGHNQVSKEKTCPNFDVRKKLMEFGIIIEEDKSENRRKKNTSDC
jgi:N-acetylmuramoyl-L-alanine amidase